jgi:RNA recognition motif-containing protein
LNFNSTEQDVKNFFKGCGNVGFVKLLKNDDGRSKGRGFVKFSEEEAIHKAMELNGKDFMGRAIKIEIPRERENNN